MIDDYTRLDIDDFLNQLAERTPTPGGGGATAGTGAIACALARMVAAYSVEKKTEAAARARIESAAGRLRAADEILRALITEDAVAYARMTEAGRNAGNDPATAVAYDEAVLKAIGVPMEMAAVAANALQAMDDFKEVASRYLLSDLAVAAILAEVTARAARYTVGINVPELTDVAMRAKLLTDIERIEQHSAGRRASIENFVRESLASDRTT